ncbi:hypothetical protein DYB35_012922, partial [Aphanomyces astaci]
GSLLGLHLQHNDATKGVLSCLELMLKQLTKTPTDAAAPTSAYSEWVQAALTGTGTAGLFAVLDSTGRVAPEDKAAFVQNLVTAADEAAFRRAVRQFSKLCRQRAVVV